ncbi:MAG: hypothetical protein BHW64_02425 [Candidatus Melainabacteria bacterium LEY3_CP_29_8]|nr:MAG: hypothetical protein BHW64_02425 [Candidatus Melainabacteria bacterium LEY3_CP_29_8]
MINNLKKIFLVFFISLILSGCSFDKDYIILFNTEPITQDNYKLDYIKFEKDKPIYYAFLTTKYFEFDFIRVQIVKASDKTNILGYSIAYTKDFIINRNKQYFTDYIILRSKGHYIMQIFYHTDLNVPLVQRDFWVE